VIVSLFSDSQAVVELKDIDLYWQSAGSWLFDSWSPSFFSHPDVPTLPTRLPTMTTSQPPKTKNERKQDVSLKDIQHMVIVDTLRETKRNRLNVNK